MPTVKFGCQLPQATDDFDLVIRAASVCERLGFDSVWLYDHLSPFWLPSGQSLECWTALSAIAAQTSRVKVGSLVTNVSLRNPGLLAKMSSTVDNISGGRLILGLGTSDRMSRSEVYAYGYGFPRLVERVERLKECILILKEMWTETRTTFHGKYYTIEDALNLPKPKQSPHPPIWIGGKHPRILDVVAELADGWNYWGISKATLKQRSKYLTEKCRQYDRKPSSILKSWLGTYKELSVGIKNQREARKTVMSRLRNLTDDETRYFIASFDSRATLDSYETFADSVKSLA